MKKRIEHFYQSVADIDFLPAAVLIVFLNLPLVPFFVIAWIIETLIEDPNL